MNFKDFLTLNEAESLKLLNSSRTGLSETAASLALQQFGPNRLKQKSLSIFEIFLRQFRSPFSYLLAIAAVISFALGEEVDALIILVFVALNLFLGFYQEARAAKTIEALKRYLGHQVRVMRAGREVLLTQEEVVLGDIVFLEVGQIVPADLRLLEVEGLQIDESVLTGESAPVYKSAESLIPGKTDLYAAENIAFASTTVVSGEAVGVVFATGQNLEFSRIVQSADEQEPETEYEKQLLKTSQLVLCIVLLTISSVFLLNFILKRGEGVLDFLIFSIALVISILPEALPTVVTFALSNGALKLAEERVVVKKLLAVEELGNIEILCTDKTGTITKNKLTLTDVVAPDPEKTLLFGLISSPFANEKIKSSGNPFDDALFESASATVKAKLQAVSLLAELPFDPERLRNSVLFRDADGKRFLIVKGAPEKILDLCSIPVLKKTEALARFNELGKQGKRVLAVAFKEFRRNSYRAEDEVGLKLLGLLAFEDPLKSMTQETVALAQQLGVKLKIITGDSQAVAGAVAQKINLDTKVALGTWLEGLSESEFKQACEEYSVFARILPQQKLRIVKTLGENHNVGFLGEGVNDLPALKAANVGIVVRSASDVSREAADIVLLEKDLRTIIRGIQNGRQIFSNINKYIKATLASNFGNFYSIAVISLFIDYLPMLPIQILFANLLTDFPLISVSTDKVDAEELRRPKAYELSRMIWLVLLLGMVSSVYDFVFYGIFKGQTPAIVQTFWMLESILTELVLIFAIRTRRIFFKAAAPSWPLALLSVLALVTTLVLPFNYLGQGFLHLVNPGVKYFMLVFGLVGSYFLVSEAVKLFYFKFLEVRLKR